MRIHMSEQSTQKTKRLSSFARKLCIYALIWLSLILICCAVMWCVMAQFEASQPFYTIERYIDSLDETEYYRLLLESHPERQNLFEPADEAAKRLAADFAPENLTYSKLIREYTYETPVYLISSGDKKLLRITLELGEKSGLFGFRPYRVQKAELVAPELLTKRPLCLVVPVGAKIRIGEKEVDDTYLETNSAFTAFGAADLFCSYRIEDFLLEPDIEVTLDGTVLTGSGNWDRLYDYPEPKLHTVTITAPSEAIVRIGGVRVTDVFQKDVGTTPPDALGNTVAMCTYTVNTVYRDAEITAALGETSLSAKQREETLHFAPPTADYTLLAPEGAAVFANGMTLSDDKITASNALWKSEFAELSAPPTANEYTLCDLYAPPVFTAQINGASLRVVPDSETGRFACIFPESEELRQTYENQAVDYVKAYLHYTTQGYRNTQANLDAVLALTRYPSPLYTNLKRSYIGYMYIAPQTMTLDKIEAANFTSYDDNTFTCEVSYAATLKNFVGTIEQENTILLVFTKKGKTFLPAAMVLS